MTIWDTVGGRIIGKVESITPTTIVLSHAGVFKVAYTPIENGKKLQANAQIHNIEFTGITYYLERAGIRGYSYLNCPWLATLYAAYVAQWDAGKYAFGLCMPPVSALIESNAEPTDQIPEVAIAEISPTDTKATPNAQS